MSIQDTAMIDMIFVGLKNGKRISLHPDGERERVFSYPKDGKVACHVAIGEYLVKHNGGSHFMTSSSVNHPHEYGFARSFNVDDVMGKARAYAFEKIAVRVEPGPLDQAVKTLEAAAKKYGRVPMPILFVKSSRKRKDALLVFKEPEEFEQFLSGLMYGSNLAEIQRGKAGDLRAKSRRYLESRSLLTGSEKRQDQDAAHLAEWVQGLIG